MQSAQTKLGVLIHTLRASVARQWQRYRNNTIAQREDTGAPNERAGAKSQNVNDLYEEWRNASEEDRPRIETDLFEAVARYADAMIWQKLNESNPDLRQDIAFAVFRGLQRFREDSKFGTWVRRIAENLINEDLARRIRERQLFATHVEVPDDDGREGDSLRGSIWFYAPDPDRKILLDEVCSALSTDDSALLQSKCEEKRSGEIALMLRISSEAVDSRWRRLVARIKKRLGWRDG